MRIGYFDCFCGASGDMLLGAFLDAGCPEADLRAGLDRLKLADASVEIAKIKKQGFAATKVTVHTSQPAGHRHLHHIAKIINDAGMPERVRDRAIRIFTRLAEAEAAAHRSTVEKVHFHEVGAADAIIDIVGSALAVDLLKIERCIVSPIPTGSGTVTCEHGVMPVPAPGTAALLIGAPIAQCDETGELTTPTGAAILTTLADSYGPPPTMTLRAIGYGAGTRDGKTRPNVFRLLLGDAEGAASDECDVVVVLEANLDDATGEQIGHAHERLFAAGALDVFATPIQMKKNRPGILLSAIAPPEAADAVEAAMFRETTTFGVRRATWTRRKLARSFETVPTKFGPIKMKIGRRGGEVVTAAPEFADCAAAATAASVSVREVMSAASAAWAGKQV